MFLNENGANDFTVEELEELFNDAIQQETPPATEETTDAQSVNSQAESTEEKKTEEDKVDTTKAFAHRLKESTEKARKEEREAIAKSLGYESYDAMQKEKETKLIRDKGYDPEELSPVINELIDNRVNNDPRMKELEEFRKKEALEFGKKELADITTLTGGRITKFSQLPEEVVKIWTKTGSLKSAYLQVEGENLINQMRSDNSKGTTSHLNTPSGNSPVNSNERPLTDKEKAIWRLFNPKISDEDLKTKTMKE